MEARASTTRARTRAAARRAGPARIVRLTSMSASTTHVCSAAHASIHRDRMFVNVWLEEQGQTAKEVQNVSLFTIGIEFYLGNHLRRIVRKPDFCLCENKGTDQLRSNCEADQCLCFRYTDSTISLLLKTEISIF